MGFLNLLEFCLDDHWPPDMLRPPGTNANDRRPTRPCKGDSKGKHKDNGYRAGQPVRRAYITENDQAADPAEHQEDDTLEAIEQEPQNQDADPDPPEEEDDLSNQINEIMTVTARKLAGVIQSPQIWNTTCCQERAWPIAKGRHTVLLAVNKATGKETHPRKDPKASQRARPTTASLAARVQRQFTS